MPLGAADTSTTTLTDRATQSDAPTSTAHSIHVPSAARCGVLLVIVRLTLLLCGFQKTYRCIQILVGKSARASDVDKPTIAATARSVATAAAFFPGRALCLEQSLALYYLLRRRGVDAYLKVGVQAIPFGAHAWIEYKGEPVNEDPERIKLFTALPGLVA